MSGFLQGRLIAIEEVAERLIADGKIVFRSTSEAVEWIRTRTGRTCPAEERIPCIPEPGGGVLFDDAVVNERIASQSQGPKIGEAELVSGSILPSCSTDLSDVEWIIVKWFFSYEDRCRRGTREILNGILWRVRTKRKWHELPSRYPRHGTCKRLFERWDREGRLGVILRFLDVPWKSERENAPSLVPAATRARRNRRQTGCVAVHRDSWVLRWRENVVEDGVKRRKLRFKKLGEVTPAHRRNRSPKTKKPRVPYEIQRAAKVILEAVRVLDAFDAPISYLVTVAELVETHYLPTIEPHRKASTIAGYRRDIWERHLKAKVGGRVVRDFRRVDAFQLWNQIVRENPEIPKSTMRRIRFFVSGLFEWALNRGLYDGDNPAQAKLPEGLKGPRIPEGYSIDEVNALLKLFNFDSQIQAIFAIAWVALRKGEIEGLKWNDYELLPGVDEGAKLHVRRSVWRGVVGTPKTAASADVVIVAPQLCSYIDYYRKLCGDPDTGFMFGKYGRPIDLGQLARKRIIPILDRCAVCKRSKIGHARPGITDHEFKRDESVPRWKGFHAFRRGAATYIVEYFRKVQQGAG